MTKADPGYILTFQCVDRPGITAAVAQCLFEHDANIIDAAQFGDSDSNQFFSRIHYSLPATEVVNEAKLLSALQIVAERFGMDWQVCPDDEKPKVIIAVSRFGHCLNDLLHRWRTGSLPIQIVAVVSNHEDMRKLVEWQGLDYYYLPIDTNHKQNQEAEFARLDDELDADLIVLARYMQILSPELCAKFRGRCINIHHSFLPGFRGAKPYQAAHDHGVKMIGATAHYVTADLDEGPIIEQDVQRVSHRDSPSELADIGGDIEARVLARAVKWHIEPRVFVNGGRTIVLA